MTHRDYLFSLEHLGIKLGLDQIRALVAGLGHPDRMFTSVIVAGTNGKGSVTAMIERGLRAAGVVTGRYTSPHLVSLNERFAVNGRAIADDELEAVAGDVRAVAARLECPPSFFEATTALALEWFRRRGVGIAVIEVGLGGRLDATNVVTPVVAVITAIDFDHQDMLGGTLPAIAAEKAGVIKPGCRVVLAPNPPEVEAVVAAACAAAAAPLVRADAIDAHVTGVTPDGRASISIATPIRSYPPMTLGLRGRHQVSNAVTATLALEAVGASAVAEVPPAAIRTGIEDVHWPGRLQLVSWRGHELLVDGAHNPAGARALAAFVAATYRRLLPFVVGIMADKEIDEILAALAPAAASFVFTAAATPRAASAARLVERAAIVAARVPARTAPDVPAAIDLAVGSGGPVVAAGSLYLAGEVLANLS